MRARPFASLRVTVWTLGPKSSLVVPFPLPSLSASLRSCSTHQDQSSTRSAPPLRQPLQIVCLLSSERARSLPQFHHPAIRELVSMLPGVMPHRRSPHNNPVRYPASVKAHGPSITPPGQRHPSRIPERADLRRSLV